MVTVRNFEADIADILDSDYSTKNPFVLKANQKSQIGNYTIKSAADISNSTQGQLAIETSNNHYKLSVGQATNGNISFNAQTNFLKKYNVTSWAKANGSFKTSFKSSIGVDYSSAQNDSSFLLDFMTNSFKFTSIHKKETVLGNVQAITEIIKNKDNVCHISTFGLKNSFTEPSSKKTFEAGILLGLDNKYKITKQSLLISFLNDRTKIVARYNIKDQFQNPPLTVGAAVNIDRKTKIQGKIDSTGNTKFSYFKCLNDSVKATIYAGVS